jgi:hypothetical protein
LQLQKVLGEAGNVVGERPPVPLAQAFDLLGRVLEVQIGT